MEEGQLLPRVISCLLPLPSPPSHCHVLFPHTEAKQVLPSLGYLGQEFHLSKPESNHTETQHEGRAQTTWRPSHSGLRGGLRNGVMSKKRMGCFPTQLHSSTQPACILWCKGTTCDQQGHFFPAPSAFGSLTIHAEPVRGLTSPVS